MRHLQSAWLLAILLLTACTASRPADEEHQAPIELPVTQSPSPTAVPAPTKTPILPVPSLTPPPTATVSPQPSPSPSPASTPTPQPLPVSFAVIGDYGTTGQGTEDVAALVNSWNPDFVITLGDNNYPDGAAETIEGNITRHYGRFIAENRFFPALGNHDMTTDDGRPYLDFFDLPGNERYYDFIWGDVHLFALNSDWREPDGITSGSRQADWLQERLASSTSPWQVVYVHVPPYVSMEGKIVPVLRWPFAAWGADLVLSGHAHMYERLQIEGITYIVNGLGGGGIYNFDEQPHPASQIRFNDNYGALLVKATAEQLVLRFVTREGTVVDEVSLP